MLRLLPPEKQSIHALLAAEKLAERGLKCRVVSMHTIKPLDTEAILKAGRECCALIVTVEEHMVHGGLGEACAAVLIDAGGRLEALSHGGLFPDEEIVHNRCAGGHIIGIMGFQWKA